MGSSRLHGDLQLLRCGNFVDAVCAMQRGVFDELTTLQTLPQHARTTGTECMAMEDVCIVQD